MFKIAVVSVLVIVSVVAIVCANYFFCVVPVVGVLLSVLQSVKSSEATVVCMWLLQSVQFSCCSLCTCRSLRSFYTVI